LLSFVYKAAAEIGELGDNTRALRAAIAADDLLHRAVHADGAEVTVLGHTRWASVGIISEANAHPLNSDEDGRDGPYVVAALNGDVDNHAELRDGAGLRIPPEVTTDAKVIPTLVSRAIDDGASVADGFRTTVRSFHGSVAIGASVAEEPGRLLLALRGSGQALYAGLAEDAFIVASEPYGLVEECWRYLRMDGESPSGRSGEQGQVLVLDRDGAGTVAGITRFAYDGTELPVGEDDLTTAEITTRDIDRGDNPHFFIKEIFESPTSLRKTLRGKLVERDGRTTVELGEESLPAAVRAGLAAGSIARIVTIGQGTAAIAAQAVAASIIEALRDPAIAVESMQASELSGFGMVDEMDDTLVVAISQSGTSADTNRTVDLVRARGASVIAIVNRRNSDLTDKADGVLYTSDGRDVEMAVASTKAFYAQIAAGVLLASAIAEVTGRGDAAARSKLLEGLRQLPAAMDRVLEQRESIGQAAAAYAPPRTHWSVVGNGLNRIAANEIRIKLSELAYKSIGVDATEEKKHIDLSAEPLLLVCAAGLDDAIADDVGKEVAIFRAHKSAPIVIATEGGEERFGDALATISVPEVHPSLAFVLSAMAGHLFGYEAALSIDAGALPLRAARGAIETVIEGGQHDLLERLAVEMASPASRFAQWLDDGRYNGTLDARTAVRVTSLLRYALGLTPLDTYELDHGKIGTPGVVIEDLTDALTRAIEQLTRPIDAIKHQAKTVTVGTSRSEEALFEAPLVAAVLEAGAPRDRLSYRSLRMLSALGPAIAAVTGFTRYAVDGDPASGHASATVLDKGGSAAGLRSRTEPHPVLQGTKNLAARQRAVTAAKGSDGRTLVIVPETKGSEVTGLTLLHVDYAGTLEPAAARAVLEGYQTRMAALTDAVLETEASFDDAVLGEVPIVDLLTEPVHVLRDAWRSSSA
jgi:glucosamine--fructose-6-phosphate aminotransferase (isomerizing)